jgi:hypothetical protein
MTETNFKVELIEEHEDGDATFRIEANAETMRMLFETFMKIAIINGIESTQETTEEWIEKQNILLKEKAVIAAAEEIEVLLRTWETSDELDYDPVIQSSRERLTDAVRDLQYASIKESFE